MGLSSSQARLLNLTARMHQIEYKAAKLEAQKLQMANESNKVYENYLDALDKTKIQIKRLSTDGSINYVDATYNTLMNDGYRLSVSGAIAVSQTDIDYFNNIADNNAMEFACLKSGYAVKNGNYVTLATDSTQYLAFDAAGLKSLAAAGKNIILMDDIQVTSSLGTLKSTLNGNGHILNVNGTTGAFSAINGGTVKNLNINANINSTSTGNIGALANTTSGNVTIENVSVNGTINSKGATGGLIGQSNNGSLNVSNVSTNVSISGATNAGGILAVNNGSTIDMSKISGNVNINSSTASGGLIGISWWASGADVVDITYCSLNTNISVSNGVAGGLVGMAWDSVYADNCYVSGTISSESISSYASAGGIFGGWGAASGKGDNQAGITSCYTDVTLYALSGNTNPSYSSTGDMGGLIWSTSGSQYMSNCASSNGTSAADLYFNAHNLTFTEAADANAVKTNVLTKIVNQGAGSELETTYDPETIPGYANYYEIGKAIASGNYFLLDGNEDNSEWLTNMVNNGMIILEKPNNDGEYYDISVSTDTNLQEISDDSVLRKAEAKYEADMKQIDLKDRKYDTDLAALDTERNAIKQEMETLKTVAKENVERTFKLFS